MTNKGNIMVTFSIISLGISIYFFGVATAKAWPDKEFSVGFKNKSKKLTK